VVELAGLEPPSKRLCETSDELLFGSSSVRESQHLLLTRPCDRCIKETGDTDSARKPTLDSSFDEAWREEANDIVMLTWRLLHASRAACSRSVRSYVSAFAASKSLWHPPVRLAPRCHPARDCCLGPCLAGMTRAAATRNHPSTIPRLTEINLSLPPQLQMSSA
jgi:hypothetical protein